MPCNNGNKDIVHFFRRILLFLSVHMHPSIKQVIPHG